MLCSTSCEVVAIAGGDAEGGFFPNPHLLASTECLKKSGSRTVNHDGQLIRVSMDM
jgi:hypothetical protein